ncbi:MAG: putative zinc-binding protein [Candidatus Helarchaeota archaeon]
MDKMREIEIIACSGAEYNGEIARQVAIILSEKSSIADRTTMLCLTIFLRNFLLKEEKMFNMTKEELKSSYLMVIDGCSGACIFKILKSLDIKPDLVVNLNKLIPKPKINFNSIEAFRNRPRMSTIKKEHVDKVVNYIMGKLEESGLI